MAYHDTKVHGPMKQKTIITFCGPDTKIGSEEAHDKKVNTFNTEHTVFFNQSNSFRDKDGIILVTVCLYADGASK